MGRVYSLRRLFVFRTVVMTCELFAILVAAFQLRGGLPLFPMMTIMLAYALLHTFTWLRLRRDPLVSARGFFLHLVVDVLALALLFYFSGGSANPFVSLFMLPLIIVAITLPRLYVWSMASVTLVSYSLLMVVHVPLAGGDLQAMHSIPESQNFQLHVLGMWFSFLMGVGVILFFVMTLAEELRRRDHHLAEIREKQLRDEHIVALGTMAAGAAHEFGTPLSTMAVLIAEMQCQYTGQEVLTTQLGILRSQVQRCKSTLSQLSASAGQLRAEGGREIQLDAWLHELTSMWQARHPDSDLLADIHGSKPVPRIVVDDTLNQALVNILNNAADASPERIEMQAMWTAAALEITIRDFGSGLQQNIGMNIGKPFFTTKTHGQGLGVFLARAVIGRLGGTFEIGNHAEQGALVTIRLPFTTLST